MLGDTLQVRLPMPSLQNLIPKQSTGTIMCTFSPPVPMPDEALWPATP